MRRLFVPACLCIMTWSSATGFDLPLEKAVGSSTFDKRALMRAIGADAQHDEAPAQEATAFAVADIPEDVTSSPTDVVVSPQAVPLPPKAKPIVNRSRTEICDTVAKAAHSNDLPLPFFIRLLFQESRFKAGAVSSSGAEGIAQFMPDTSASEGLDNPFDPLQAIPASARLLRKLVAQFGNLGLAAAAYNAGPKRIHDWLAKKDKLPQETKGYVKTVTGKPAESWRVASANAADLTLPSRAPCKETLPPAEQSAAAKPAKKAQTHARVAAKGRKAPVTKRKTPAHEVAKRGHDEKTKIAQR
jgi:hypothetical protein